jgi:hypothetical protein
MFLTMVRRKVARVVRGVADDDEELPPMEMDKLREREAILQTCAALARNTVSLALTVQRIPNGPVLVQDLHTAFNAAIILLLNLLYSVNLLSADTVRIDDAIMLFEDEALTGNAYCIDCAGVLRGLRKLVKQLRPTIFENEAPEPQRVPSEHLLAGRAQLGAGLGLEMDIDPPAFPLHGRRVSNGATVGGSRGQDPAPPIDLARVSEAFERWESTHAMSLYTNGGCMVDMSGRPR